MHHTPPNTVPKLAAAAQPPAFTPKLVPALASARHPSSGPPSLRGEHLTTVGSLRPAAGRLHATSSGASIGGGAGRHGRRRRRRCASEGEGGQRGGCSGGGSAGPGLRAAMGGWGGGVAPAVPHAEAVS